jgi:hypothetical protein
MNPAMEEHMPHGEELAHHVTRALAGIPNEARRLGIDANGGWPLLIKQQLAQLGDALDYAVRTSGTARPGADGGPWSDPCFDITWLHVAGDGTHAASVPLVLEFEWHLAHQADIDDNFQELLLARADLRVMVFQQRTAAAVQAVMDTLERQAKACAAAGSGAVYLLCGYDWEDTRHFAFRTFAT